jgi:hypothetical protein
MPPDDARPSRFARPTTTPPPTPTPTSPLTDDDDPCVYPDCEQCDPNTLADRQAEFDAKILAELRQQIKDIDEGREEPGVSWEEARRLIFAPPTPEELAEIDEYRARRALR